MTRSLVDMPLHRRLTLLGAAVVAVVWMVLPAQAAAPTSGTLTDTSAPATWTGGPFVVPNVTGQTGTVQCNAATQCDDFALTVSTPAGFGDTHNLKITVQWPTAAADFDVYVLDAAGNEVTSAASSSDPETILMPPNSGTYTVRVVPFAPLGQSYSASAAMVAKPVDPPPSTATPPTYVNYAAPETLVNAHNAGEPSIGNNFNTGATMYQSYVSTYKTTFNDATTPATATWTDASAKLATGCPQGSTTSLDPILFTDHQTGRTFESQLTGQDSFTCFTDNDGASWLPSQGGGIPSGVDHQTIGGGAFSANGVGKLPTSTYPNAVYYCSQDIATAFCATSRDGGLTFGPGIPTYSLLDCGGLHGHAKVAPDGTVYVPNKGCGANQAAVVSEDNGATWAVRPDPASTPGDSDPSIGIGANGTAYMGYQNSDGTPRIATSHDKGKTWQFDQNVGASLGIKNSVFPAVVAGDDNRAAYVFIGTTTPGNYQDAANFHGVWHLYIATTYDGGQSWVTVDATPTDPVQKGSICTGGTTCGQDRNLLDFIDVTIDSHGRVLAGYADGCTGACATGGAENFDALATIARQSGGQPLFAAFDPLPNATVSGASATVAGNGSSTMRVSLANTGKAPAKAVTVRFTDNGALVGTSAPVTLAPGATTTVTVPWNTKKLKGTQQIVAVADPTNAIRESDESDNKTGATVRIK